jgi:uncharacterized repeat protein (TIGR03803 family)
MRVRGNTRLAFAWIASAVLIAGLLSAAPLQAQTFSVIHDFTGGTTQPSFPAGGQPVQGRDGNLYGESYYGGTSNTGTIFRATPSGTVTVVHDTEAGCGIRAIAAGNDGNIYGACNSTSAHPNGYIWKLTLTGTFTDLHNFDGTDGANPLAPVLGTDGNVYGVTEAGGANNLGTFYKLVPSTSKLTTLYTFGANNIGYNVGCWIQGTNGNFYCSSGSGGGNGDGALFSMSTTGKVTLLHTFAGEPTDGSGGAGIVQSPDGNFYGSTAYGGTSNQGTIFKMTPSGAVTLLHSFNGTTDGGYPAQGISLGSDGNLYGTANDCASSCGTAWTAFRATRTGSFTVLHTFNGSSNGALPDASMVEFTDGLFYGVCEQGGSSGDGTLWTINTGLKPFLNLSTTSGKVESTVGILGQDFDSSSVVKFNGVAATKITLSGTTYITATVPAGATDGKVTVTTGTTTLTSTQTFIVHNTWASGTPIPTAISYPAGTGFIGTKIYVVGGGTASGNVDTNQVYNTSTNAWSTATALPATLAGGASAVVDGILYVFGGYSGNAAGTAVNSVYAYDPATNSWSTKTSMPTARGSATAVVDGATVYVIGGNNSTLRLNTVEAYDTANNSWSTEADLLTGKSDLAGGFLGGEVFATDGYNASTEDNGDNEAYSTSTKSWSTRAADPQARNSLCYGVPNGQLVVAGGVNGNGAVQTANESYNATTNAWTTKAAIPQAVAAPASAVANGLLYCIGGSSSSGIGQGTFYKNVQIYQP